MKRPEHNCLARLQYGNEVATRIFGHALFTVPVARIDRMEVEKLTLEKAKVDRYQDVSNMAIAVHKKEGNDKLPIQKILSARSAVPTMNVSVGVKKI